MYTGSVRRPVCQNLDVHRQGGKASLPGPGCTGSGWKGLIFFCVFQISLLATYVVCRKVMFSVVSDCQACLSFCQSVHRQ